MIPNDFKQHELWQLLEEIAETVNNLSTSVKYEDEEDKRTVRNRLPLFISTLEQHSKNTADYYSVQMLNTMEQQWVIIRDKLNQLEDSPSYAYEIDQELDKVSDHLASWPNTFTFKGFAVEKAIGSFDAAQSKWAKRIEFLEQQIHKKDQELEAQNKQHQEACEDLNEQIKELRTLLEENENLINEQNKRIDSQTAEYREIFKDSQNKRSEAFDKTQEELNVLIKTSLSEQRENFKQWFAERQVFMTRSPKTILQNS